MFTIDRITHTEVLGVCGYGLKRLGRDREEQAVEDALVLKGDVGDLLGKGEDEVEVLDLEQVGELALDPSSLLQALALRAVAITAGVCQKADVAAGVAGLDVKACGLGAAPLQGPKHDALGGQERGAVGGLEGRPVATHDVAQFDG